MSWGSSKTLSLGTAVGSLQTELTVQRCSEGNRECHGTSTRQDLRKRESKVVVIFGGVS